MGKIRILIPELLGSQVGVGAANSVASSSTPAQNLATHEPWQIWRSASAIPEDTWAYGHINGNPEIAVNAVALAALNMVPGNGEVRAVLATLSPSLISNYYEEMVPTAIVSESGISNVSGGAAAVGDVDEGSAAADSGFITEDATGSGAFVIFDFGTPAAAPVTGARKQCFTVRVRASAGANGSQPYAAADTSGAFAYRRPSVTVSLYENVAGTPTLRLGLGTKTVFGTGIHDLHFSWDAALLATTDGSNVQIRIDLHGFNYGGSFQYHPDISSLFWACDSGGVSSLNVIADSGWSPILADAESGLGVDYSTQLGNPYTRWQTKFDDIYTCKFVVVMLREDGVPSENSPSGPPTVQNRFLLRQPPGYVQCGRMCVGLWWSPEKNFAHGQIASVVDPSDKYDDDGGSEWGSRREPRDVYNINLEWLTAQEAAWLHRRFLHELGTLTPFYLELEPDSTFEQGFGGLVTLLSVDNPLVCRDSDTYPYSLQFAVRVKR